MKRVVFVIGLASFSLMCGAYLGFREGKIMQGLHAHRMSTDYVENLEELNKSKTCSQYYWPMYYGIDGSIGLFLANYNQISMLKYLPMYSHLKNTETAKMLLQIRMEQLDSFSSPSLYSRDVFLMFNKMMSELQ